MKITVLYAGLAEPHAGWAAVDELAELIGAYFHAEILSTKKATPPWPLNRFHQGKKFEPIETAGGDVLIVIARQPGGLAMINGIANCRKKFGRIFGIVTDSYFRDGYMDETGLFDMITVTSHDDMAYPNKKFGVKVHQLYQGADCLAWAPRTRKVRDIDIIGFGRIPKNYHTRFTHCFHRAESPYLYLHSPLGNLTGSSVHLERGMLFKVLQRTRISLAFNLFVETDGNRPRSMMVTSRWLESLLAGCIVAGRRPVSRMADEMLFWPGATIELSENPEIATEELNTLLADNDSMEEQRLVNISQMIANHDWRHRIVEFSNMTGLPRPEMLSNDIEKLGELGASFTKKAPGIHLREQLQ
jgi:hypothetical protein